MDPVKHFESGQSRTSSPETDAESTPCGVTTSPPAEVSLTHASRHLGRDRRLEAIARTAAYLRCIGLDGQSAAESTATTLIDQIMAHPSCWVRSQAVGQAVDVAVGRIERWMQQVSSNPAPSRDGLRATPTYDVLAIHRLRAMLHDHPQTCLRPVEALPNHSEQLFETTAPATAICPGPNWGRMPRQQFGKLPTMFRLGFWQRIYRRVRIVRRVGVPNQHASPTTTTEKQVA